MRMSPESLRWLGLPLGLMVVAGGFDSAAGQNLSRAAIDSVVEGAIALVKSHYVFPDRKAAIAGHIRARLDAGHYYTDVDPDSLAERLTRDLRFVSKDRHLYIEHASDRSGDDTGADVWAEQERILERLTNFGFTEARVLEGNVGYLRIVEFMHPQRGFEAASSAMRFLANTDATVIDVRGNGGGYGGLMNLVLSSYFEPEPAHISTTYTSDSAAIPTKSFTLPFVPGERRNGQPLYILIDRKTGSAAEFFAYTLQAFDRATIIGEPSAGAANLNSYYDINERFRISVSTGAPVNPITNTNWEGVGVQPAIAAPAGEAVDTAHLVALQALLANATNAAERERLADAIARIERSRGQSPPELPRAVPRSPGF